VDSSGVIMTSAPSWAHRGCLVRGAVAAMETQMAVFKVRQGPERSQRPYVTSRPTTQSSPRTPPETISSLGMSLISMRLGRYGRPRFRRLLDLKRARACRMWLVQCASATASQQLELLTAEPWRIGHDLADHKWDAVLAALAELVATRCHLPCPEWATRPDRYVEAYIDGLTGIPGWFPEDTPDVFARHGITLY
jgi:hypothetical protein